MIRNFLIPEISESIVKTRAPQQRSLDSLGNIPAKRLALEYLLPEQNFCAEVTPPAVPGLTLLGKLNLNYLKSRSKVLTWLKKVTPLAGSFFDFFDFDSFGSGGPWTQSTSKC